MNHSTRQIIRSAKATLGAWLLCLLWQNPIHITTVSYAKQVGHASAIELNRQLLNEVRTEWIRSLPADQQKGQLEALIKKIASLQVSRPKAKYGQDVIGSVPDLNSVPSVVSVKTSDVEPIENQAGTHMQTIVDPNTVSDPFKMAEILNLTGRMSEAVPFYQRALAGLAKADPNTSAQRQWILLQLGHCLLHSDPLLARQMFSALISEYPDSKWLALAVALQSLADWYIADKPEVLLRETNVKAQDNK